MRDGDKRSRGEKTVRQMNVVITRLQYAIIVNHFIKMNKVYLPSEDKSFVIRFVFNIPTKRKTNQTSIYSKIS